MKVNIPHPFRPIVVTCGTALAILSKWLDYILQQLKPHILTYIKDSSDFLKYTKAFQKLQKNGRLPKKMPDISLQMQHRCTLISILTMVLKY